MHFEANQEREQPKNVHTHEWKSKTRTNKQNTYARTHIAKSRSENCNSIKSAKTHMGACRSCLHCTHTANTKWKIEHSKQNEAKRMNAEIAGNPTQISNVHMCAFQIGSQVKSCACTVLLLLLPLIQYTRTTFVILLMPFVQVNRNDECDALTSTHIRNVYANAYAHKIVYHHNRFSSFHPFNEMKANNVQFLILFVCVCLCIVHSTYTCSASYSIASSVFRSYGINFI